MRFKLILSFHCDFKFICIIVLRLHRRNKLFNIVYNIKIFKELSFITKIFLKQNIRFTLIVSNIHKLSKLKNV